MQFIRLTENTFCWKLPSWTSEVSELQSERSGRHARLQMAPVGVTEPDPRGANAGCCSFCSRLLLTSPRHGWPGIFQRGGWAGGECIILIVAPAPSSSNVRFLMDCIPQPSTAGSIHRHPVLIMRPTIMSQSLASRVRKLTPPTHLSLLCYSMQIEGGGGGV